ncbi:M23 family metallopeptidase [Stakelama sediminis]|uniref:Murein DD-endopeptidase MepM/ murein hydrolase activator NlpD n=1 Tax=Stakelama sediminis TaxID=463200 RepID=A0A840YXR7_9SPHN|nr:murein DD-endopeptidase MepM/ murein hydrolase activator NlpD [Stakelama sediminis]
MFLRNEHGLDQGGGSSALSFSRALAPRRPQSFSDRLQDRFPDFDLTPDLGSRIGSAEWWRGLATCTGLCAVTLMLSPGIMRPIDTMTTAPLHGTDWEAARSQTLSPLALGSTTGTHMAPTRLVSPLANTPERPIIDVNALIGKGDDFESVLRRAGVGKGDADTAAQLVTNALGDDALKAGTRIALTLGRRADKSQPRPLEKLSFRARFDLALEVSRGEGGLSLTRTPIAIDHTPLRIQGVVGSSLYRSARAAGAPASAVAAYIKAIAAKVPMTQVDSDDTFDIIIQQQRAATGEVQLGQLLYAGLDHDGKDVRLLRWQDDGKDRWYSSKGIGKTTGMMMMPVQGRITSGFGMRMHPLLHVMRMHDGIDIAAPRGTPIHAATDGTIVFAGRASGYGNFVRLKYRDGYSTGYGHMRKIAVHAGERVKRGDVIGYVGSTGLSTGPHLHFELRKNGRPINPRSVSLSSTERLTGSDLRAFRAKLAQLMAVPVGASGKGDAADQDSDD